VGVRFAAPVPIVFRNIDSLAPGSEVDLWSLDPEQGGFSIFGGLRVNSDGTLLETIWGGVLAADWHAALAPGVGDNGGDTNSENDEDVTCVQSGSRSSLRSGKLTEEHSLVGYRSMGKTRSLRVVYNSTSADPQPIISSNTTVFERSAVPNTLSMKLSVGGIAQGMEVHTRTTGLSESRDETIRQSIQFDAAEISTGLYPYRLDIASNFRGTSVSTIRANTVLVNNERRSPYGAGWTIDGVQRLYVEAGMPQVVLTEGDGRIKVFTPQNAEEVALVDIVFVMDGSGSMSAAEWALQREGFASAVESPTTIPTDGSVKVAVVQFANLAGRIEIPLTAIDSSTTAQQFADAIRNIRQRGEDTPLAEGVDAAVTALGSGTPGARQVICVSTDGFPNNAQAARDSAENALAAGVDEIDALAVGPGASVDFLDSFVRNGLVVSVGSFNEFAQAIRQKLRTVIGGSPAGDFSVLLRNSDGTFTRRMKDGIEHHFSPEGLHTSTVERSDQATTFGYDGSGRLASVTDPAGLFTRLEYAGEKLARITDPAGRSTLFEHDTDGCLISITDPDGSQRLFAYDDRFRLESQVSKRGFTTRYEYDFAGRHMRSILPDGTSRELTPAQIAGLANVSTGEGTATNPAPFVREAEHVANFTDGEGSTWTYRLDRFGRETDIIDPLGRRTQLERDSNGLPVRILWSNGRLDALTYDNRGNLLAVREAVGTSLERMTSYEYEPQFNLVSRIMDPGGFATTIDYDSAGNPTTINNALGKQRIRTYVSGTDLVESTTDENMHKTVYSYDAQGLLATITDAVGSVTQYRRDGRGNVLEVTEGFGTSAARSRSFTYDDQDRVRSAVDGELATTTFDYDQQGNLLATTNPTGQTVNRTYDGLNQVIEINDPIRGATTLTYDSRGNLRTQTDALSAVTTFEYDEAGQLARTLDALGGVEQYDYDSMGNVECFTDALNHTTTFDYDLFNRRTERCNPLGQCAYFYYDSRDNLASQVTPNGDTMTYEYDALRRLRFITAPDNAIEYQYDEVGNLRAAFDDDSALEWTYDHVNRVEQAKTLAGENVVQPMTTITYTYDAVGNRIRMEDSEDGVTLNAYDNAGRLRFLTTPAGDVIEEAYDPSGRFDSIVYPNGIVADYVYDTNGRLQRLKHAGTSEVLLDFTYEYNTLGNITQISDPNQVRNFTYDALQRLRTGGTEDKPEFYDYDAVGNRTASHLSSTHVYDNANRLIRDDGFNYTYDANGNLRTQTALTNGRTTIYSWDTFNRLVQIDFETGTSVTYRYDGLHRRTLIMVNNVADHFVYGGDVVHLAQGVGGAITRYVYGDLIDQPLALQKAASTYYYHVDHLGSVHRVTDAAGTTAAGYEYDSFGQNTNPPGFQNALTFAGREEDAPGRLLYLRARYYQTGTGRFLSEDPGRWHGFVVELSNLYTYVESNPINFKDPEGREKIKGIVDRPVFVHPNDLDPRPSDPHAHIGSPNSPHKINIETGEVFHGGKATGQYIEKKKLAKLRKILASKGLLKKIPLLGIPLICLDIGNKISEKGLVPGLVDSGLDAIPIVGIGKGVGEFIAGEDLIPSQ
jgi:RHS repeat-associated protein